MYINRFLNNQKVVCRYLLPLIFVAALSGCDKESPVDECAKDIVVDGNLHDVISYDNLKFIERLTINGEITSEDWNILNEMAIIGNLSYLDMTEAKIIGDTDLDMCKDNEIPSYQFTGSRTLQTVLLPRNLKGVGSEAFASCSKLHVVSFSNSLEFIGDEAFSNCSNLTSIELPQSIDSIGVRAFYKTPLAGELILPKGLRIIAKQAFAQTNIVGVTINHDVYAAKDTKMYAINNNSVFASCKYLQKVTVEEGCTFLEVGFTNCESLTELILPSTLKYIGYYSKSTHNYIFKECKSLINIELPEGLTYIGMHAFDATSCQTLDIPKTVEYIGEYSFKNANIHNIIVHWNKPLNISKHTFDSYDFENSVLYIPKYTAKLYQTHEHWGLFGRIVEI